MEYEILKKRFHSDKTTKWTVSKSLVRIRNMNIKPGDYILFSISQKKNERFPNLYYRIEEQIGEHNFPVKQQKGVKSIRTQNLNKTLRVKFNISDDIPVFYLEEGLTNNDGWTELKITFKP